MNNGDAMVTTAGEKHTVQLLFCGKWIRRLDLHPLSELIHRFGCSAVMVGYFVLYDVLELL